MSVHYSARFAALTLSFPPQSEKDDHSRLPDIYNITYKTPSIQYRSKTWSFLDLLNELKKGAPAFPRRVELCTLTDRSFTDTIKSVWSQKGALLGQLLQTAHRRLPLTDARYAAADALANPRASLIILYCRAAAKKSFKTSLRTRLNLKSPSSSRSNSALELPKSSPLARNPSSSDKGTPSNTPPSRPSPQREPSPNSSSSDLSDDEIVGDGPIGLPFDVNTTHLLDSEEQFVQEPEEMSIRSDIADASSGSRSAQESEREKELAEVSLLASPDFLIRLLTFYPLSAPLRPSRIYQEALSSSLLQACCLAPSSSRAFQLDRPRRLPHAPADKREHVPRQS